VVAPRTAVVVAHMVAAAAVPMADITKPPFV